jgi:uncharacterized membrane protein YkvA (DUF1232 family)
MSWPRGRPWRRFCERNVWHVTSDKQLRVGLRLLAKLDIERSVRGMVTNMNLLTKMREAANRVKRDAITVYFLARDAQTPMAVRLIALAIAAYAFSPVDLIPDFIPVLGLLDDLILIPLGISLVIKLAPAGAVAANRVRAAEIAKQPTSTVAAIFIVAIWILAAAILGYWVFDHFIAPDPSVTTEIVDP